MKKIFAIIHIGMFIGLVPLTFFLSQLNLSVGWNVIIALFYVIIAVSSGEGGGWIV